MRQATLLFLIKGDRILLAMKKRGFGQGRWNGVGGKPEEGESIEQAAIRECQEEICVTPIKLTHVATLDFHFSGDKAPVDQQVTVYNCSKWRGNPAETEEMRPKWYSIDDIPYDEMWSDDKYWLPQVLENRFVRASFVFDDEDQVDSYSLETKKLTDD